MRKKEVDYLGIVSQLILIDNQLIFTPPNPLLVGRKPHRMYFFYVPKGGDISDSDYRNRIVSIRDSRDHHGYNRVIHFRDR